MKLTLYFVMYFICKGCIDVFVAHRFLLTEIAIKLSGITVEDIFIYYVPEIEEERKHEIIISWLFCDDIKFSMKDMILSRERVFLLKKGIGVIMKVCMRVIWNN